MVNALAYRDFPFPLNVYAHILTQAEGQLRHLHYGLYAQADEAFLAAQGHADEMLLERLPAQPSRILEVGIGVGTLLGAIAQRGHTVTGLAPDATQIAYASAIPALADAGSAQLLCSRLEDYNATQRYDAIICQESAQYLRHTDLLKKAADLLAPGGSLLILDEFVEWRDPAIVDHLPYYKYFMAQASRQGFVLREEQDLTQQAQPTLAYIKQQVTLQRQDIQATLGLRDEDIAGLLAAIDDYQREYARGRLRYRLLAFTFQGTPRWQPSILTASDLPAVQTLFQAVFGHPLSAELSHWKYGEGRGQQTGIWHEGELIAHYGGMTRRVLFAGQPCLASQMGDSMVKTQERGVLTRKGAFFLSMTSHVEQWTGWGTPHPLCFGFPNARHMAVGVRLGLYGDSGKVSCMSWSTAEAQSDGAVTAQQITPDHPDFARSIDGLWQAMAADLPAAIVGIRDAAFVTHRYFRHPHISYQAWLVQDGNAQAIAAVLLKSEGATFELMDYIGPLSAIPATVETVKQLVARQGGQTFYCWISEPYADHFTVGGGNRSDPDVRIPYNAWCEGPAPADMQDRWWLMGGDTDFH